MQRCTWVSLRCTVVVAAHPVRGAVVSDSTRLHVLSAVRRCECALGPGAVGDAPVLVSDGSVLLGDGSVALSDNDGASVREHRDRWELPSVRLDVTSGASVCGRWCGFVSVLRQYHYRLPHRRPRAMSASSRTAINSRASWSTLESSAVAAVRGARYSGAKCASITRRLLRRGRPPCPECSTV